MFHLTYIARELRTATRAHHPHCLGLALGVGLVIGIIGVSQGLDEAQEEVLAPLQSVGTDILVTRVAGATPNATTTGDGAATTSTTTNAAGPRGFFRGGAGGPGTPVDIADIQALEKENSSVATDLSKLGKPGEKFAHDFFLSATLLSFPDSSLAEIKKVDGVSSATGGLTQLAQHQTGTVPNIVAEIQTGGEDRPAEIAPPTADRAGRDRQVPRRPRRRHRAANVAGTGGQRPGDGGDVAVAAARTPAAAAGPGGGGARGVPP